MRVLYVTYPDYIYSSGLIWTQVFSLFNKQCEKNPDLKVTLLCFVPFQEWLFSKERSKVIRSTLHPHIQLVTFPAFLKRNWILPLFPIFLLITGIVAKVHVQRFKPDLIHTRGMLPGLIAHLTHGSIPWVLDMRGLFPEEGIELGFWKEGSLSFRLWKKIESTLLKSASAVNFVSEKMEAHFNNRGGAEKSVLIPSGVDTNVFYPNETPSKQRTSPFTIVYSGSSSWENLSDLHRLFRTFTRVKPNVALKVFLPHANKKKTDNQKRAFLKYFSPNEIAFESCWPEEVPQKLRDVQVGVITRKSSMVTEVMWPIKCLEYWASSLPVLTNFEVDSVNSWIKKERIGALLSLNNEQEDQSRLVDFLAEYPKMKKRCREVAESRFSMELTVEAYMALYKKVLKNR